MLKKFLSLISMVAIASAIGCSTKSGNQVKSETVIKPVQSVAVQLKITPSKIKLVTGKTMQYTVIGIDSKGKTVNVSANWKLTGSKTALGTLDSSKGEKVTFTAKTAGKATLEAEYNNLKASAVIEVVKKK